MGFLFDNQPPECRQKLDISKVRDFDKLHEQMQKLVLYDPSEVYERLDKLKSINPFKRFNSIGMCFIFPPKGNGICSCGCGKQLTGRQSVWGGSICRRFPLNIQAVLSGHSLLRSICTNIFSSDCVDCGISEWESKAVHELDHICPVKLGGGCSWLNNYEFRCKTCHRKKTNKDFGFKEFKNK